MTDRRRTKAELIEELDALRARLAELEASDDNSFQAEEAMRASEQKYRFLYEASPAINIVVGTDGLLREANNAVTAALGYSPSEVRGQPALDFVEPEQRGQMAAIIEEVLRGAQTPEVEARIRAKDGSIHTILFSRGELLIYEEGEPSGVLFTGIDTTERTRAEEALRQSEERYRQLVDTMNEGFGIQDEHGVMTYVNDRFCEMVGRAREELVGRAAVEFMDEAAAQVMIEQTARREKVRGEKYDICWTAKDGAPVHTMISPGVLRDGDGRHVGSFAVITDITDRKKAEDELKKALREKEILLKEIHHRLRNNLQMVCSLLDLQMSHLDDARAAAALSGSRNRVRAMALIHEKLYRSPDLARLDAREYLSDLIRALFESYCVVPEAVGVKVNIDEVALDVETAIPLALIINELVSNCIEHAYPAGRRGEIAAELRRDGGGIRLVVADSGVGLPRDVNVDSPKSLGLQLVSMLTDQLSGTIEVARSGGTAFTIRVPMGVAGRRTGGV